jgi:hypothetical protein
MQRTLGAAPENVVSEPSSFGRTLVDVTPSVAFDRALLSQAQPRRNRDDSLTTSVRTRPSMLCVADGHCTRAHDCAAKEQDLACASKDVARRNEHATWTDP